MNSGKKFDIIVVGAGHAGIEAALAGARMGFRVLVLTINPEMIGAMSCNPAIGGLAKGQIVKEIDALGGEMAKAIDATGIQFRTLNTRKGPAVRSSRAQADMLQYRKYMRRVLESEPNIEIWQGEADAVLESGGRVKGVNIKNQGRVYADCVILTTGTFLRGLIHIGLENFPGGRWGEPRSEGLSDSLRSLGFELGRLKTGTPARLDKTSINFEILDVQYGDNPAKPFSFDTEKIEREQIVCHITYTNERTHEIIRSGLDRSPLYTGVIKGIGPRYCPSIEDKVVKFPDKLRHHIFLEPVGLDSDEIYPNGISTSLPVDIQEKMIHSIAGLEQAKILKPGYGIEYDFVKPTQLKPSLETKAIEGLFLAGQINGTSGYEEAAGQGLIAGINAVQRLRGEDTLILDRSQAYIGVLIDDLITKGTDEPYRMFTSRAEYRLLLREDNADLRLREIGYKVGLVKPEAYDRFCRKKEMIERGLERLAQTEISYEKIREGLVCAGITGLYPGMSLKKILKRPEISWATLKIIDETLAEVPEDVAEEIEIQVKYEGYIERELREVERFKKREMEKIPDGFNYDQVSGMSNEVREKLKRVKPISLGQASRIPGVTPAAISLLQIFLKKIKEQSRDAL